MITAPHAAHRAAACDGQRYCRKKTTNKLANRCSDMSRAYPPRPKRLAPASCSGQPTSACPPGLYLPWTCSLQSKDNPKKRQRGCAPRSRAGRVGRQLPGCWMWWSRRWRARWRSVITASAHYATDDTSPSASSTQCHALLHTAEMGRPACQCRHAVWICSAGQALGGLGGRCRWSGERCPSEAVTRLY